MASLARSVGISVVTSEGCLTLRDTPDDRGHQKRQGIKRLTYVLVQTFASGDLGRGCGKPGRDFAKPLVTLSQPS
jgi:hypothetical protein